MNAPAGFLAVKLLPGGLNAGSEIKPRVARRSAGRAASPQASEGFACIESRFSESRLLVQPKLQNFGIGPRVCLRHCRRSRRIRRLSSLVRDFCALR